jgi:hypothetical protein
MGPRGSRAVDNLGIIGCPNLPSTLPPSPQNTIISVESTNDDNAQTQDQGTLSITVHGHSVYQLPLYPVPTTATPQSPPPTITSLPMPMQGLQRLRIPCLALHDLSSLKSVCGCIHFPSIQFIKALMTMTTTITITITATMT